MVKFKIKNILAIIGVLSILVFILLAYLLFHIANPGEKITLKKYDAIVILSGNPIRAELGGKLFQNGFSKLILVSKEKAMTYDYLKQEKKLMTYEFYSKILIRNKVPKSAINIFGEDNKSTYDEAKSLSIKKYDSLENLLIVTNSYHIFRSKLIFKKLLPNKNIDFISPEVYMNYEHEKGNKIFLQLIFLETFKTIHNIIFRFLSFSSA
ncbi:MAG: YdcF family protein [Pseudomonadota bacterium]|nr:YdcF family protein [Pseudomonadota bacterium]